MECSLSALWLTSSLENHTKPWTFLFVCFCKNEWPRWEHSALSLIPCFHSLCWHRVIAGFLILSRMRPRQPETSLIQSSPTAQVKAPFWVLPSFSHHCKNPSNISKESSEIYKRICHEQVKLIPGMQAYFNTEKSIHVTCQCRRCRRWIQSLVQEDPLQEKVTTDSSILAYRIPWTEEPGGIQSIGHTETETTEATKHMGFLYDKEEKGNGLKLSCRKPRVPSNISACDFF